MKKIVLILILVTLIIGCQSINEKKPPIEQVRTENGDSLYVAANVDTITKKPNLYHPEISIDWTDSLLLAYMAFSENELIRSARKSHLKEEWLLDSTLQTDTAVYQIYQIGHDVADEGGENQRFVTDQWVYLDTLKKQLYEYDLSNECLNKWTYDDHQSLFYPVYELSPKTVAFVVNLTEDEKVKGFLDVLLDQVSKSAGIDSETYIPKGSKLYDNTGPYKLMKSDKFEKAAAKYFDREFYIYGTTGHVKTRVKDIVIGLDQCMTNIFAFCLDKSKLKSIGHPVFCSDKLIDLTYSKEDGSKTKVDDQPSQIQGDYTDSVETKVLGNVGDFYFAYSDDFLWGKNPKKSKSKFPTRWLYLSDTKSSVVNYWDEGLDLFGIPCD
jgi:hypothetical protein